MKGDTVRDDETTASDVSEPEDTTRRTATSSARTAARRPKGNGKASSEPTATGKARKKKAVEDEGSETGSGSDANEASLGQSKQGGTASKRSNQDALAASRPLSLRNSGSKARKAGDDMSTASPTPSPPLSKVAIGKKAGTGDSRSASPTPSPSPPPPSKLATGKKAVASDAISPSPTPSPSPPSKVIGRKAGTGDSGSPSPTPSPSPSPSPEPQQEASPAKKKKGRLGRLGAAKRAEAASQSPEPGGSQHQPSKGGLGKLGGLEGKKKRRGGQDGGAGPASEAGGSERGSPHREATGHGGKSETIAEPKIETSDERAARRRAELARDLEKKRAAGPAKKKRKF